MTSRAGPLAGKRILVTRRGDQAASLSSQLAGEGATVVELPLIAIRPPEDPGPFHRALRDLGSYAWLVLTSANAVWAVAEALESLGLDSQLPGSLHVASVGPSTTQAFGEAFSQGQVSVEPASDYRAEGLLRALEAHAVSGQRILLPLSQRAGDLLARGLAERGALVETVTAYRTVPPEELSPLLRAALDTGIDLVTLASPSAAEHFVAALPSLEAAPPVAVIGPVTERAARSLGLSVRAVASPATASGLVDAVRGALS